MAEKIVNSGIEFAYTSNHIEVELKRELEKYFMYQDILIFDSRYEFGSLIEKLQKNTRCNIIVERNIVNINKYENVGCIVAVNDYNINEIKLFCKNNSIPYIIALTKLCDSSVFKSFAYDDYEVKNCNLPLGITFSLDLIFDKRNFISKAIMEISSLSFVLLEDEVEKLFFDNSQNLKSNSSLKKILRELKNIGNIENLDEMTQKSANLYLNYAIFVSKYEFDVLDNLLQLYKKNQTNNLYIEAKYIFSEIITSLQKNYFLYWTTKFQNSIDIKKHTEYMSQLNIPPNFKTHVVPENKISFLLCGFKDKLLSYVNFELAYKQTVKNLIAEINVDFLYNIFSKLENLPWTNYICIEEDIFKKPNFLSILYNFGLLNFDF